MNIDIFPWNEHFETGLSTVDSQHRKLVKILNDLATNVAFNADEGVLNAIFDELTDYTLYHFETEEAIWHHYLPDDPLDSAHQSVHQQFIETALRFKEDQKNKPLIDLAKEALEYLARWLASHILETDRHMAYIVFALQEGLSVSEAKIRADQQMSGSTRMLIDIILSIYRTLTSNTLELVHEMKEHEKLLNDQKIIESKLQEQAQILQKQKEEFETIFNISRDGIAILDLDSNFLNFNEAYLQMTGFTREELLCQSCIGLSIPEDHDRAIKALEVVMEKGFLTNFEKTCVIKNGKRIVINMAIALMPDRQKILISTKDVTEAKAHEKKLQYIAHYDALTGLPNRVLLYDRMLQAMAQASRNRTIVAVVYLDLDGFKAINDLYGHDIGDTLLSILASRMKQTLRNGDTISRLGGDEFVAVFLNLKDHEECVPMLIRLLSVTSQSVVIDNIVMNVSASLGVSFFEEGNNLDPDQLLRQADQAMYQAKLAGKNRYHIFDAVQDRTIRTHHESLDAIEAALFNREFRLYYQPKVNMQTGEVIGAEALIRWEHPLKGILSPASFLPTIEGHSLSVEIGYWVIEEAMRQITLFKDKGFNLPISVNVDALQLQQEDFVDQLIVLLKKYPQVQEGDLECEIVETSALEDIDGVSQVMKRCEKIGIHFSLDDFGTGYSSLTYLKRLPAKILKIDQSFVKGMLEDPDDLAILDGVIGLSVAFRRNLIAEGVESFEHGEMLINLGCVNAQGYAIARPMSADNFIEWLKVWRPDERWLNSNRISRDDIALVFAEVEHKGWVGKIIQYITNERFDLPPLDEEKCHFGQWLASEAEARYKNFPLYTQLREQHSLIHTITHKMLEEKHSLSETELQQAINSLSSESHKLIEMIKQLRCYH